MKAYGSGGTDYLSKPFDISELSVKIEQILASEQTKKVLSDQLQSSYAVMMNLQNASAQVQLISSFVQAGMFCRAPSELIELFFRTSRGMNLHLAARIRIQDEDYYQSDTGSVTRLEREILDVSRGGERICRFGMDRAIYNWEHVTLLVKKVGEDVDNLAIMLDAFEAGINAVNTESRLLNEVKTIEAHNSLIKDRISDLSQEMNSTLKATFLSMGLVSQLEQEEEDRLTDFVQQYNDKILDELDHLSKNNQLMLNLINELRKPPPELLRAQDEEVHDGGGISFF
jgi:CheY-like chemotaxis protein